MFAASIVRFLERDAESVSEDGRSQDQPQPTSRPLTRGRCCRSPSGARTQLVGLEPATGEPRLLGPRPPTRRRERSAGWPGRSATVSRSAAWCCATAGYGCRDRHQRCQRPAGAAGPCGLLRRPRAAVGHRPVRAPRRRSSRGRRWVARRESEVFDVPVPRPAARDVRGRGAWCSSTNSRKPILGDAGIGHRRNPRWRRVIRRPPTCTRSSPPCATA